MSFKASGSGLSGFLVRGLANSVVSFAADYGQSGHIEIAFDKQSSKSILGLVIRDVGGEILASKTVIHTEEIGFHFIPKAENEYAHILAQEALKKGEGHYLLGAVLSYVRREMEKRRRRQPD
ncbi:hypothetical protein GOBAR_DD06529 [Gossypium barbadense]|nr:hypothetical protein GOBAR_DD06529 [Gossypium barbadense]